MATVGWVLPPKREISPRVVLWCWRVVVIIWVTCGDCEYTIINPNYRQSRCSLSRGHSKSFNIVEGSAALALATPVQKPSPPALQDLTVPTYSIDPSRLLCSIQQIMQSHNSQTSTRSTPTCANIPAHLSLGIHAPTTTLELQLSLSTDQPPINHQSIRWSVKQGWLA